MTYNEALADKVHDQATVCRGLYSVLLARGPMTAAQLVETTDLTEGRVVYGLVQMLRHGVAVRLRGEVARWAGVPLAPGLGAT
jgi:hypothetical protein